MGKFLKKTSLKNLINLAPVTILLCSLAFSLASCRNQQEQIAPGGENIQAYESNVTDSSTPGSWGYIDKQGEVVIEPRFSDAWSFHEGLALVEVDGKLGYINKEGDMVIEPHFSNHFYYMDQAEQLYSFSEGMAVFQESRDSYGYINTKGDVVVEPCFVQAYPFSDGLGMVEVEVEGERKSGYINKNGDFVVEPQYSFAAPFQEGMALVSTGSGGFFIDPSGNIAIPSRPEFASAFSYSEGLALVDVNHQMGYIDKNGNWAIEPQFPFDGEGALAYASFSDGLALVYVEEGTGQKQVFIDKTGSIVISPPDYYYYPFHDSMARFGSPVEGFIDTSGKVVIELQGGQANDFSEGLAYALIQGPEGPIAGFIDKTGKMVIKLGLDRAKGFSEGLAPVAMTSNK